MKTLVKPVKPMMLMMVGGNLEAFRPSVVVQSTFLESKIAAGQVKVILADLPDEVTDEDFLATYSGTVKLDKDGKPEKDKAGVVSTPDEELAISSFKKEIPALVRKAKGEEKAEEKTAAEIEAAEKAAAEAKKKADEAEAEAKRKAAAK